MIGETISHYRLLEKLGAGGMGVVYAAEDLKLGRKVALKFLSPEYSREPVALRRFEREARTASALNHPNICTIYDIDEFDGRRFIAMEFLKGMTLKDWIGNRPLPMEKLLDFANQIVAGLEAAHAEGIIHRDIKPANVFVTQLGYVKLLDFGLAKLSAAHHDALNISSIVTAPNGLTSGQDLTFPGAAIGTIAYMSPEQALGEPLDVRTDLFSFGTVLYQMVTGRQPFSGNTSVGIIDALLHKAPSPAQNLNPSVPRGLQTIINKAMEKDRELRYQTATDLRVDLQRLKRNYPNSPPVQMGSGSVTETQDSEAFRGADPSTPMVSKAAGIRVPFLVAGLVLLVLTAVFLSRHRAVHGGPSAQLRVSSRPGAQVIIDGKSAGTVGGDGSFVARLTRGEHQAEVRLANYQSYSTEIDLAEGESKDLVAELLPLQQNAPSAPRPGSLMVRSNLAGADILIDGVLKGVTTDDGIKLEASGGSHTVQVRKEGYQEAKEQSVQLSPGREAAVYFTLTEKGGVPQPTAAPFLVIQSLPGAQVEIDGSAFGSVPSGGILRVESKEGKRAVQVSMDGYETFKSAVDVNASGKTLVTADLKALPPSISSFASDITEMTVGQTAKLSWATQNAGKVHIEPAIGSVPPEGTHEVSPSKPTTYLLTATGPGGSATATVHIIVRPNDNQAINETLARFKGAYDSMDINAIKREWPTLTKTQAAALRTTFLGVKSLSIDDECAGSPTLVGDTAEWSCVETIQYILHGSRQIPNSRNSVIFHFERDGREWRIERRESR